ncbi:MAG: glucosamine-6-phosphate deaminase [Clostridiaceae bacterium]|nr:glucosamine-6-phosphate deaminase [Clostridiaceae bacterium]
MSLLKELTAGKLKVRIYDNRKSLGANAALDVASKIRELLKEKPEINMIFAAAPSQNEFLENLLKEDIEWNRINAFHMDEYIGLDPDAPQGFGNFLKDRLFGKADFKSVNYINGNAEDPKAECERYADLLKKYPTDIVCFGIGENGHLAFNDPPVADFEDPVMAKIVELDPVCRQQQVNDGCFASLDLVPTHAITITIPGLMAGKYLYGMVPGKTKTEAVARTVRENITTECPATILRNHDNAILYTDSDSAKDLL